MSFGCHSPRPRIQPLFLWVSRNRPQSRVKIISSPVAAVLIKTSEYHTSAATSATRIHPPQPPELVGAGPLRSGTGAPKEIGAGVMVTFGTVRSPIFSPPCSHQGRPISPCGTQTARSTNAPSANSANALIVAEEDMLIDNRKFGYERVSLSL